MNRIEILKDRALQLAKARSFFFERDVVEVDVPLITSAASVDTHIDLIPIVDVDGNYRYLHSSPEYGMKRLISEGIGDIYQLAHVFRQGEWTNKHNPEFTMAEWYRIGVPFSQIIQDTVEFIQLFLGNLPVREISYREAIQTYVGIDYVHATEKELFSLLQSKGIEPYAGVMEEGKDALLNLILGTCVEPQLGRGELTVLAYYPSTQAALAQTIVRGDEKAAERFEVYYEGVELANGYHELANAKEQRLRLVEANEQRIELGKKSLPIDERFLEALEKGMPDCCGVAVGFDRLMMLRHKAGKLADVLPFDWQMA